MRTLIALLVMTIASTAYAADLAWDHDEYHDLTDGFTIYFTDGTEDYTYTFPVEEAVVDGDTVKWGPIEDRLNLHPGVEYSFNMDRHNASGTSGIDGQDPVTYEVAAYIPPPNRLPEPVSPEPSEANGLRIE